MVVDANVILRAFFPDEEQAQAQALIRECREELNIAVRPIHSLKKVHHTYTHFKIKLNSFICEIDGGLLEPLNQQPIQWITIKEIEKYPFPGANHKIFPELKKYLKQQK